MKTTRRHIPYRTIFGLMILFAFCALTAKAYSQDTHTIISADFNHGHVIKGMRSKQQPGGWHFMVWSRETPGKIPGGMSTETSKGGNKSLEIPVTEKGMMGWRSNYQKVIRPAREMTISGWVKCSKDYKGNTPRLFLTWFNKKKFLSSNTIGTPKCNASKWSYFKYTFSSDQTPKEADTYQLNLATIKSGKGTQQSGKLFFDEVLLTVPVNYGTKIKLRDRQFAGWHTFGNPVVFKADKKLGWKIKSVTGKIHNANGKLIETITTPAKAVSRYGWIWTPKAPGFYRIKFLVTDQQNKTTPIVEEYIAAEWGVRQRGLHSKEYFDVVIAPGVPRPASKVSPMFGFNAMSGKYNSQVKTGVEVCLANLLESSFIRFHGVKWLDIEPQKGRFEWAHIDMMVELCINYGMEPILNFFAIPKWASPHPDEEMVDICVIRYSAYAPNNMNDWTNFLKQMVTRYKDRVNTWEVWNEQHFPNSTCFWNDTPENYVRLLKSAYETIKENQPDSTVWIGGMGNRYLPYYDKIMSLGAGKYFDKLVFHGHGPIPEPFNQVNDKYKVPRKPWVNSEWHAFLVRYGMPHLYKIHNDITLSRRMLKDMIQQINDGCERIAMFELMNIAEWETLGFKAENGNWSTHCSGMFRTQPYLEPRFQAVAWRNFSANFAGPIKVSGMYMFGAQRIAAMESDMGKLLVVWHEEEDAHPLDAEIAKAISDKSVIHDWQGRVIEKNAFTLEPNSMYYISNPSDTVNSWEPAEGVLVPVMKPLELKGPKGRYCAAGFIDPASGKLSREPEVWNTENWFTSDTAAHSGSRFALALTKNGLDLVVDAIDGKHIQENIDSAMWKGDSVQFAIDTTHKGYECDRLEFQAALSGGKTLLYKEKNPSVCGDLPTGWSAPGTMVKNVKFITEKTAKGMRYLIHINRSELYPYDPKEGDDIRFSILINDNDGDGRKGWVEWASGIGKGKDPTLYGTLKVGKR